MKTNLNLKRIARDSIRMYFAPLTGAYKGIREEMRRIDADSSRNRLQEARERDKTVRSH